MEKVIKNIPGLRDGSEDFTSWVASASLRAFYVEEAARVQAGGSKASGIFKFNWVRELCLKCSVFKLRRGKFSDEVACESCILSFVDRVAWPRTYWLDVEVLPVN